MSDSQKPYRDMYGWTRFKGTRNEWAWWWLEFHFQHHAKEQDDMETEVFCHELKKTKDAYDKALSRIEKLRDALEFYAKLDHELYKQSSMTETLVKTDGGDRARQALALDESESK